MIKKSEFEKVRKEIEAFDAERENLIGKSNKFIKLTKQVIYCLHREEIKEAEALVRQMKSEFRAISESIKKHPGLYYSGVYKIIVQEYVEAISYYNFLKEQKLIDYSVLKIDPEHYLLGLCDLTGELVRKAVNSAIKGDYETALKIKEFVSQIYGEFIKIDLRNGEVRRKFDGIKYDLKKLEDLALDIKLKGK